MVMVIGYVGHLKVIAYPNSEIPHYIVPEDGFTTNVHIVIKKGTYVGTVKFTTITEYKNV